MARLPPVAGASLIDSIPQVSTVPLWSKCRHAVVGEQKVSLGLRQTDIASSPTANVAIFIYLLGPCYLLLCPATSFSSLPSMPHSIAPQNDVEVGESLPPQTAHVSHCITINCCCILIEKHRLSVSHCRHGEQMWDTKKEKSGSLAK